MKVDAIVELWGSCSVTSVKKVVCTEFYSGSTNQHLPQHDSIALSLWGWDYSKLFANYLRYYFIKSNFIFWYIFNTYLMVWFTDPLLIYETKLFKKANRIIDNSGPISSFIAQKKILTSFLCCNRFLHHSFLYKMMFHQSQFNFVT